MFIDRDVGMMDRMAPGCARCGMDVVKRCLRGAVCIMYQQAGLKLLMERAKEANPTHPLIMAHETGCASNFKMIKTNNTLIPWTCQLRPALVDIHVPVLQAALATKGGGREFELALDEDARFGDWQSW